MQKNSLSHLDLSKQGLEFLKDTYVQEKVNSMNEKELKSFVFESIQHQIKDTIGNEEETEAWREMQTFFDETFEGLIHQIKQKFKAYTDLLEEKETDQEKRSKLLETNTIDKEKEDMWED